MDINTIDTPELEALKETILRFITDKAGQVNFEQKYFLYTDIAKTLIVFAHLPIVTNGNPEHLNETLYRYSETIPELGDVILELAVNASGVN